AYPTPSIQLSHTFDTNAVSSDVLAAHQITNAASFAAAMESSARRSLATTTDSLHRVAYGETIVRAAAPFIPMITPTQAPTTQAVRPQVPSLGQYQPGPMPASPYYTSSSSVGYSSSRSLHH